MKRLGRGIGIGIGIVLGLGGGTASPLSAQARWVVVSGLSGEGRFAAAFAEWTGALRGVAGEGAVVLTEGGEGSLRATRDNVVAAVRTAAASGSDVVVVLFGHGGDPSGEPRLNLPGPDITAAELAGALAGARGRVTVVNTASASGGFVKALAGPNRIVIAATRSGNEQNETLFPAHFVAALTGTGADTDKDGRVSALEAFEYARREVERAYSSTQRLQTEHPVLEADGDGVGSASPQAGAGDGAVAALAFFGGASAGATTGGNAALRALQQEKAQLESALASLRAKQSSMAADTYQRELEQLLLALSRNGQAMRRLQGGGK